MMNKRKWLYRIGVLFISIGLILANVYSDIPPLFPSLHKGVGIKYCHSWSVLSYHIKLL